MKNEKTVNVNIEDLKGMRKLGRCLEDIKDCIEYWEAVNEGESREN